MISLSSDQSLRSPERLESEHRIGDSFQGPVVLLDDAVEIFALAHLNIYTGNGIDAVDGSGVGSSLLDSDFRRQAMELNGTLQVAASCSLVPRGRE